MPWIYHQRSGPLEYRSQPAARRVGTDYSGAPAAANDHNQEVIHFKGPITKGQNHVGAIIHHHEKGPHVVGLAPVGHTTHHRTDLVIHGPKKSGDQNRISSKECIVLPPETGL